MQRAVLAKKKRMLGQYELLDILRQRMVVSQRTTYAGVLEFRYEVGDSNLKGGASTALLYVFPYDL